MITVEKIGKRYYVDGSTEWINKNRFRLIQLGFIWDKDEGCWYTGIESRANDLLSSENKSVVNNISGISIPDNLIGRVQGLCEYNGNRYWILFAGYSKSNKFIVRLSFLDGTKEFWAKNYKDIYTLEKVKGSMLEKFGII